MDKDKHLENHLKFCHKTYQRLKRNGLWLWEDSPISEDLLESGDITEIV